MRAILLAGSLVLAGGCSADAGTRAQSARDFQVGAFDRIALAGSPDVVVTVGGQPSIRAEGDAEAVGRLEITAENGELRIGMRPGGGSWIGGRRGVTVHITMPALQAASITGSGDIRVDRVEGARFAGQIGGSGDMDIASLRVAEASFSVQGSGDVRAAGAGQRATLSTNGSGDLDLGAFEAADATVAVTGSGNIALRATRTATIEVNGSGDVNIAGPARCTISKSGSGDVNCGG